MEHAKISNVFNQLIVNRNIKTITIPVTIWGYVNYPPLKFHVLKDVLIINPSVLIIFVQQKNVLLMRIVFYFKILLKHFVFKINVSLAQTQNRFSLDGTIVTIQFVPQIVIVPIPIYIWFAIRIFADLNVFKTLIAHRNKILCFQYKQIHQNVSRESVKLNTAFRTNNVNYFLEKPNVLWRWKKAKFWKIYFSQPILPNTFVCRLL